MNREQPRPDPLTVFLRCWISSQTRRQQQRRWRAERPDFKTVLVIDAETYPDLGQHLLFGSYRFLRKQPGTGFGVIPPVYDCVEEGLFYDPDSPFGGPPGLDVLRDVADRERAEVSRGVPQRLRLRTLAEFNEKVFHALAYDSRALVVGFNLPFDLSRLAYEWASAKPRGISLALSEWQGEPSRFRPRVVIEHVDCKRAFAHFTTPLTPKPSALVCESGQRRRRLPFQGRFLDLRTLSFALSDSADSLDSAAKRWNMVLTKGKVEHTGRITYEYIEYNRNDVRLTSRLLHVLLAELYTHPVDLSATDAWSPASVGKSYLRAMRVRPRLDAQPGFPVEVIAHALHAYYGGRAECTIRRVPVPVVYVDFLSMYPSVCALMGLWKLMTCQAIEVVDATDEVRAWLDHLTPDDIYDRAAWTRLVGFVELIPDGDVLPVRAEFAEGAPPNIAVAPVTATRPLWYTIADVVGSTLLTGRPPRNVLRAVRLAPAGTMSGLRPLSLRGSIPCDPRRDDFFRLAIEERQRIRNDSSRAKLEERLSTFLKVLANATSYGIWLEANPVPVGTRGQSVILHGLDGPIRAKVRRADEPGEFCFPPLAACITGAARLMLALLQRSVHDKGGCHAFCDTDSMAIVATPDGGPIVCPTSDDGDAIHALSWRQVDEIVERFAALNPYDRDAVPGSILKIEVENYARWGAHKRKQAFCYAISAKRYALFNLDRRGRIVLRKTSEHGLGHLLPPSDRQGSSPWTKRSWLYMMKREKDVLAPDSPWWENIDLTRVQEPTWLHSAALGRITITSPELVRRFAAFNASRDRHGQVRPFNFLLTAFVAPSGHPAGVDPQRFQLVTPFTKATHSVDALPWIDRHTGTAYGVTTDINGPDQAQIITFRDHLHDYMMRPEAKACGPNGAPCTRGTVGQLRPRGVAVVLVRYIGKESNNLDDAAAAVAHDLADIVTTYRTPDETWHEYVVPILRDIGLDHLAALLPDVPPSSLADYLQGRSEPHSPRRQRLLVAAADHARRDIQTSGQRIPRQAALCCAAYMAATRDTRVRRCACGLPLSNRRARHCSPACRQRAYRRRVSPGT
jgi:hypothetical protein